MKKQTLSLLLFLAICVFLTSCSNVNGDEPIKNPTLNPTLNPTSASLYVGETIKLTYSENNCTWSSENSLIASVQNGIVTANLVGSTKIRANNLICNITVKPRYNMYKEPYMKWYSSLSTVKNYMSSYDLHSSDNSSLIYLSNGNVSAYSYTFENNKLIGSAMLINNNSNSLVDFILERYLPIDYEGNLFYFASPDKKTIGAIQVNSGYEMVAYLPYETSSVRSSNYKNDIETLIKNLHKNL